MRKGTCFVRIYPAGISSDVKLYPLKDSGNEIKVSFMSDVDRSRYVKEEYNYCRIQEQAHLASIYRKDRFRTMKDLLNKRVEFAKTKGLYQ